MAQFISMRNTVHKMMHRMELELKKELLNQGHKLTGKLINSIRFEVKEMSTAVEGLMYFEDYYGYVDKGVTAKKIPYSHTGGSMGRTSKYIEGLIRFWKLRGKSDKQAKGAAFATANKHKQEGMPTKSSYSFSKNNKRTGFLSDTVEEKRSLLERMLREQGQDELQLAMKTILKEHLTAA